jgi:hypothetical protein
MLGGYEGTAYLSVQRRFRPHSPISFPSRLSRYVQCSGPGSSVSMATDDGLDGPGIESWGGQDFLPVQTGPGAHPASCTVGTGSFRGVKCGRGVLLTPHPLLELRSWKSRAILLPSLWSTTWPVTGLLYLTFCVLFQPGA